MLNVKGIIPVKINTNKTICIKKAIDKSQNWGLPAKQTHFPPDFTPFKMPIKKKIKKGRKTSNNKLGKNVVWTNFSTTSNSVFSAIKLIKAVTLKAKRFWMLEKQIKTV